MQAGRNGRVTRAGIGAVAVLAALIALVTGASAGVPKEILLQEDPDVFNPVNESTTVGDGGANWDWGAGTVDDHNVRQNKKLFYSGAVTNSGDFNLSHPSAGTFPYYCETHGNPGTGMHGTLKVKPRQAATKMKRGEIQIGVQWAEEELETGNSFDVQYRVDNGDWDDWKKDTPKVEAAFGKNGKPVKVKASKTYKFRVRSQLGQKASEFSPALTVHPNP